MTRSLSDPAKVLLKNARSLADAAEFLASGQSTFGKWVVPGLLPQQCTAALYSPTGTGKSFFALHLALSIAAALPWFGKALKGGTVVYLVTEDRPGVEARAIAAARHMGLSLGDISFEFVTPFPVHAVGWAANLIEALSAIRLRNEQPIVAVFLDTLGASFGGRSQDDAAQMTLATDAMQAVAEHFSCAFVAVHHSGKDEARGMRGSQVLRDRVDTVLTLAKPKGGSITVNIEKQRNGALGAPLMFRLATVHLEAGLETCVVEDLAIAAKPSPDGGQVDQVPPPCSKPGRLPRDSQTALDALKGLANGKGAKIEAWRSVAYQNFGDRDGAAKRQAFNTAKKRLINDGMIAVEGDTVSFSSVSVRIA